MEFLSDSPPASATRTYASNAIRVRPAAILLWTGVSVTRTSQWWLVGRSTTNESFDQRGDRSGVLVDPSTGNVVTGVSLRLQRSTAEDARLRRRSDRLEATMETPRSGIFPRGLLGLLV